MADDDMDDDDTPEHLWGEDMGPVDYMDFKRGDCWILAAVLAEQLDWEVYVGEKGGVAHHAFAYDPETGDAADVRGFSDAEGVLSGSRAQGGVIRPLTETERSEYIYDRYGDEELDYVESVAAEIAE